MRTITIAAAMLAGSTLLPACADINPNGPSNTEPIAAFTPNCALLVCSFADGSSDADGQLTSYTWDFGDGTPAATTKDAQHTYAAANTYSVNLTVTDNDGAANNVTKSVQVSALANASPIANFTSSCTDLACSFTDQSTDVDGTIAGFHWNFGDGTEATTRNSTHAYASAGAYMVELTVTDDGGATGNFSQQMTVTGLQSGGPTANFAGSCPWDIPSVGRIHSFHCAFTDQSIAAAGSMVTSWAWDFGVGRSSTEQNPPVLHYSRMWRPGVTVSVLVRLVVTDNNGLTNSITRSVTVGAPANAPPTADFASSCTDLACTFTDRSTDGDGTVVGFHWIFGDGADTATQNPTHAYASAGAYVVELIVTDNDGATNAVTKSVQVNTNAPPTANFSSSCADLACSFTDLSRDADGTIVDFRWDFGDGAVATTRNPMHAYASADTYVVGLTVTDDGGRTSQLSQPVTVTQSGGPTANFAGSCMWSYIASSVGSRLFDAACTFTDQSTAASGATVTSWAWDFGDQKTSSEQNPPVHHYHLIMVRSRPLSVTVKLTVTDNNGLTSHVTNRFYSRTQSNPPPTASN